MRILVRNTRAKKGSSTAHEGCQPLSCGFRNPITGPVERWRAAERILRATRAKDRAQHASAK